ncbi:MAG TPA: HD domain-containing protein [Pyrinomonadaceae bacterium]|jgi:hypothetical protein|nr:HD domain-containing protein [Pyrinomonadaceae bacterium]
MKVEQNIPLIDDILDRHQDVTGSDLSGYRNHVYRMINFCFAQGEFEDETREKLILAGCFHDIGIWTGHTFDYLPPSIDAAEHFLASGDRQPWIPEISEMIDLHHRLRSIKDKQLAEVFRRGDLIDFSLGIVKFDVPASFVAEVKAAFPNAGFHKNLVRIAGKWIGRHPLNPIPVLKW